MDSSAFFAGLQLVLAYLMGVLSSGSAYAVQVLGFFCSGSIVFLYYLVCYDYIMAWIASIYASRYRPAPILASPSFTPEKDVSVICLTLDPPPAFKICLARWFENSPMEIIIVSTVEHLDHIKATVREVTIEHGFDYEKVKFVCSEQGNRKQFVTGIRNAKGSVICKTDDHIFWTKKFLINMLACLENPEVGAAGASPVNASIPEDRRSPDVITPWEVAGAKRLFKGFRGPPEFAMARWHWCLNGCIGVYRASILQDPKFINGYLNDSFLGAKLDVGEDTWVTRYLLRTGWIIYPQCGEDVQVWRTVKRTRRSLQNQLLRWERSSIQSHLRFTFEVPRMWSHFYIALCTLDRIVVGFRAVLEFFAWISSIWLHPYLCLILLSYCTFQKVDRCMNFIAVYPYMAKYWWVAILADFVQVLLGPWTWATLMNAEWERGEGEKARIL